MMKKMKRCCCFSSLLEKTTMSWLFFLLLEIILFIAIGVHGQSPAPDSSGFISIDCGIDEGTSYVDDSTGLTYVSDKEYTDLGANAVISSDYLSSTSKRLSTLRVFPDNTRSCYTLKPVLQYRKYLLRAWFTYGNYDGLHKANPVKPLQFDLHIDVNYWVTINITNDYTFMREAIIVSLANDSVSVCLINTGNGVPFISSLELRPIDFDMYKQVNATQYFLLLFRDNEGTDDTIRYPTDPFDRIWEGDTWSAWANVTTNSTVRSFSVDIDEVRAPSAVMETAVIPANGSTMSFYWDFANTGFRNNVFYAYLHFAELVALSPNQSRAFSIFLNGKPWYENFSPSYLQADYVYSKYGPLPRNDTYQWDLTSNATSTLPPILNAMEVYSLMFVTDVLTATRDVDAINTIKAEYKVKKAWTGDPCSPIKYKWDGLDCNYDPEPPSIIAVNLSSSGLTGEISPSFGKLTAIKYLDLSYNNLTGTIPDALGNLSSLKVLNLTGNNISRQNIPASLMKRMNDGLQIIFDNPCKDCDMPKKKVKLTILIPSVLGGVLLLSVFAFVVWWIRKRSQHDPVPHTPVGSNKEDYPPHNEDHPSPRDEHHPFVESHFGQIQKPEDYPIKVDSMQFTYMQLVKLTKNFTRNIGRGGFGYVYHGYLEPGTEVAVKIHSQSSPQGAKQFLAEAQNLTKARHRNLVKLVGYCIDDKHLALVYEYMPHGSLQAHLKGVAGRALSWHERIQIAIGAAQGLEYLHKWCSPPIIHRDIKSANILLGKDLEAKLADFGLSKVFSYDETHVSTNMVVGTPGYVDPEYHNTCQLTEKNDVFSFGVVLLELLTGQPPIVPDSRMPHIIQRVSSRLVHGNIDEVVDQRLEGDFDANSAWKLAELAKKCTEQRGTQRPTMTEVVAELKDCLELEVARLNRENRYTEFDTRGSSAFEIGGSTAGSIGPFAR